MQSCGNISLRHLLADVLCKLLILLCRMRLVTCKSNSRGRLPGFYFLLPRHRTSPEEPAAFHAATSTPGADHQAPAMQQEHARKILLLLQTAGTSSISGAEHKAREETKSKQRTRKQLDIMEGEEGAKVRPRSFRTMKTAYEVQQDGCTPLSHIAPP